MFNISFNMLDSLKNNWREDDDLSVNAMIRLYHPESSWECYLIGISPDDEEVFCIINGIFVEPTRTTVKNLNSLFGPDGEGLMVDLEFRPKRAGELIKLLEKKHDT